MIEGSDDDIKLKIDKKEFDVIETATASFNAMNLFAYRGDGEADIYTSAFSTGALESFQKL